MPAMKLFELSETLICSFLLQRFVCGGSTASHWECLLLLLLLLLLDVVVVVVLVITAGNLGTAYQL
jgi:hypothetical protein